MNELNLWDVKALVVDDMDSVRSLLRRVLRSMGVNPQQVAEAASGRQALEALAQGPVDLIFLDVQMPEMDGLEFLCQANQLDLVRGAAIIMLSGRPTQSLVQEAFGFGVSHFLAKPFHFADLRQQVITALAERRCEPAQPAA